MRVVKEVIFWGITALALMLIFANEYGGYRYIFFFVSFLMPVIIGTSYVFSLFLVPKYLVHRQYFKFSLYTLYTIIISLNLEILVITLAFAVLAEYQYEQLIPAAKNVFVLAIAIYFIALIKAFTQLFQDSLSGKEKLTTLEHQQRTIDKGYILVRADRKEVKILFEDILFIESLSDYVKINTLTQAVITKEKISALASRLPYSFLRIHRSFIVNADKIGGFTAENIDLGTTQLPVSRTYKKSVRQYLRQRSDR